MNTAESPATLPYYRTFAECPDHLQSETQLRETGLKPGGPVRAYRYAWKRRRWVPVYDRTEAQPRRVATPAQLAALEKARARVGVAAWERERARLAADRARAGAWAHDLMQRDDWCVLDTETTGLSPLDDRLVQLCVMAPSGRVLLTTLLNPGEPIPGAATAIHGISDGMVATAPAFADIYPDLVATLAGRHIIIYNADFDWPFLQAECRRARLRHLAGDPECAMLAYAAYVNHWDDRYNDYRWQPLPGGGHTAVSDCQALLTLIHSMAALESGQPQL